MTSQGDIAGVQHTGLSVRGIGLQLNRMMRAINKNYHGGRGQKHKFAPKCAEPRTLFGLASRACVRGGAQQGRNEKSPTLGREHEMGRAKWHSLGFFAWAVIAGAACDGGPPASTANGGGGAGGETTTQGGGGAGAAASTTTMTSMAEGGGGAAAAGCPDPLLTYEATDTCSGSVYPFADEVPNGAGAGRFGPFDAAITITAIHVGMRDAGMCVLPDPVRAAVWSEQAPMPASDAWQPETTPTPLFKDYPSSDTTPIDGDTTMLDVRIALDPPVEVPAGHYGMVAVETAAASVCFVQCDAPSCDADRQWWFRPGPCSNGLDDHWATLQEPDCPGFGTIATSLRYSIEVSP